ncbi:MAG: hypothetical protein ICV51_00885, partial [Flavisolibacter sp.]|nr:hypothetical protein [Flavisolibacter sp.]
MRHVLLTAMQLLLITAVSLAQKNFTILPEKPKAGDIITFTYEPAGAILGTLKPVEAVAYFNGTKPDADDIALKKEGKKYTGTIKTDTSQNFIYLGFSADNKWDNNFNEGYYILLNDNDGKVKKGAYNNLAMFYQFMGGQVGVERNNEKAMASMEKEMELYPKDRKTWLPQYMRLASNVKKDQAPAMIQKEIEALLKEGLKTEEDYAAVEALYDVAKLAEQKKWIASIKKEKFPNGKWQINEALEQFYREQDPSKKETLLTQIVNKIETSPDWKHLQPNIANYKKQLPFTYLRKKDWEGLKSYLAKDPIKDEAEMWYMYNEIAWELQKTSSDLNFAEEVARKATEN